MSGRIKPPRFTPSFDEEFDVVVAGYGYAGALAALEAARAGAKVLLIEKTSVPGGISICSYGAVRSAKNRDKALTYLMATCGERTSDDVVRALANGMSGVEQYVRELARTNGSVIETTEEYGKTGANYPMDGWDTFYHTTVVSVPGFNASAVYPWAVGAVGGPMMFKIIDDNLTKVRVQIRLKSEALRLITSGTESEVIGVTVRSGNTISRIRARGGVILACGGFEGDRFMQEQFWEGKPILPVAARNNTGDGIRMSQDVGAAIWHMWHFHGAYGFRHSDPSYPYALRVKRLPDWIPGREHTAQVKMAWVLLDKSGQRFMSEYQPYTQDTSHRPMHHFNPVKQEYPRIPAYLIFDENGRKLYPIGRPTSNDEGLRYDWSEDNLKEVELGILKRAQTLAGLAENLGVDAAEMQASVKRWNDLCRAGKDADFARPAGTMAPIDTPPYYGAPAYPVCSNTQGGPVHDGEQRVIDVYGNPIPGLYSAGEMGSAFGHLYLSGGNIAECFVNGPIAGRNAAAAALATRPTPAAV